MYLSQKKNKSKYIQISTWSTGWIDLTSEMDVESCSHQYQGES